MRKILFLFLALFAFGRLYAQKPLLSDTTYRSWTEISNAKLSNNGQFVFYVLNNLPLGGKTTVLTATNKAWDFRSSSYKNLNFSDDSRYVFAVAGKDSLVQLSLKTKVVSFLAVCSGYELINAGKMEWLIYRLKDTAGTVIIQNLKTEHIVSLSGVQDYVVNRKGAALIVKSKGANVEVLKWLDLWSGRVNEIYRGAAASDFIFDRSGKAMAFTTDLEGKKELWYYHLGFPAAENIAGDASPGLLKDHRISTENVWAFSSDGLQLFFTQASTKVKVPDDPAEPKIWNYQDAYLRSMLDHPEYAKSVMLDGANFSTVFIKEKRVLQLLHGEQKVISELSGSNNTDVVIVRATFGRLDELPWNKYAKVSYYACDTKTGVLKPIKEHSDFSLDPIVISPNNTDIVYYDRELSKYQSYHVANGQINSIGVHISGGLCRYYIPDRGELKNDAAGIVAWIEGTNHIIIKGTYDLWEVDVDQKMEPVNLTKGLGDKNNIIFSFVKNFTNRIIPKDEDIYISGFDLNNKDVGFYTLNLNSKLFILHFISKGTLLKPYVDLSDKFFQSTKYGRGYLFGIAEKGGSYNVFFTNDFKKIVPLSDNYPEKAYNWMNVELFKYKDRFGKPCEGLLYKPENLDPQKRYPVVLNYYAEQSDLINKFISPEPFTTGVNIPLLVSNGYIVFKPNLYRQSRQPGEAILNSVLAAADKLSSFSWVDSTEMAVTGHSFGGFETDYIVTHSDRFKAALSAAGPSNMLNDYNDFFSDFGLPKQSYLRDGVYMMEDNLANIPNSYIENSPILYAKNVSTPLLLLHNDQDNAVPVDHSIKFFVELRSLQKPCWLLQYKDEMHMIVDEGNQLNFQKKVMGFFDHFLKGKKMPEWMEHNISPSTTDF